MKSTSISINNQQFNIITANKNNALILIIDSPEFSINLTREDCKDILKDITPTTSVIKIKNKIFDFSLDKTHEGLFKNILFNFDLNYEINKIAIDKLQKDLVFLEVIPDNIHKFFVFDFLNKKELAVPEIKSNKIYLNLDFINDYNLKFVNMFDLFTVKDFPFISTISAYTPFELYAYAIYFLIFKKSTDTSLLEEINIFHKPINNTFVLPDNVKKLMNLIDFNNKLIIDSIQLKENHLYLSPTKIITIDSLFSTNQLNGFVNYKPVNYLNHVAITPEYLSFVKKEPTSINHLFKENIKPKLNSLQTTQYIPSTIFIYNHTLKSLNCPDNKLNLLFKLIIPYLYDTFKINQFIDNFL